MKKLNFFLFILLIVSFKLNGQKVSAFYETPDYPGFIDGKVRFAPLSLKLNNGGLRLALVKQYVQGAMGMHASYFFESSQQLINYINIFQFNKDLKLIRNIADSCSRDTIINRSQITNRTINVKYKKPYKVNLKYPYIFDLPARADTIRWDFNGDTYNASIYDTSLNRYGSIGRGYLLKMDPPTNGNSYILHTDNGIVYDPQNQNATVVWARKPKDGEDNQYNLKNLTFVTYSYHSDDVRNKNFVAKNSKIVTSFDIDFKYCRLLNVGVPVYADNKNGTIVGKVFLFSRPTLLTKKGQDPNKNNFEVVYCSTNGNLILNRTITLQTEKRGFLQLLYAYGNQNSINLFVAYNTDSEGFGFLKLNTDSLYEQALTPISMFNKSLVSVPNEPDIQYFMKRDQIFETFSVRKGISVEADGKNNVFAGHQLLPDGGIIIYGQRKGVKSEMVAQNGSFANAQTVTKSGYAEFFALQFDSKLQLVKQYISDITIDINPVTFISNVNQSKFVALTCMPKIPLDDAGIAGLSLESQIYSGVKYMYPAKNLYVPKIICVDFVNKTIQSYMPNNNYYVLNPDMYYLFAPDGSIFLTGFTQVQNNRTLRIEKVEF